MLNGKQYNHAMRVLEYIYEALTRLEIESFKNWLDEQNKRYFLDHLTSTEEFQSCMEAVSLPLKFEFAVAKVPLFLS